MSVPRPTAPAKPKFHSSILQKIVDSKVTKFQSFQDSLNKISADIQTLEKFLKECGLNIEFVWFTPEYDDGLRLALCWERGDANDFRLTVRKYNCDHSESFLVPEQSHRPLIAQPSEIRRKVWKHLPKFVDELSKEILDVPSESEGFGLFATDDIPF